MLGVPYSLEKWEYPEKYLYDYSFVATAINGTIPPYSTATVIPAAWTFNRPTTPDLFSTVSSKIKIPSAYAGVSSDFGQMNITVRFAFEASSVTGDAGKFEIIRNRASVETVLGVHNFSMPGAPVLISEAEIAVVNVDYRNDDEYYLKYTPTTGTPTVQLSDFSYEVVNTWKIFNDWVFFNYLLPDLSMFDLIKDFFLRFGIIDKKIGNTMHLKTLEEIINDRAGAVNWQGKRVSREDQNIDFSFGYSKENYFSPDDHIGDGTGIGSISIANEILTKEQTPYTSPFGNSGPFTFLFAPMAEIRVYDLTSTDITDFKDEPGLRIVYMRDRRSPEQAIGFGSSTTTSHRVGVFDQPNEPINAGFQYVLDTYYNRVGKSLQKIKAITRYYNLDHDDIENFDKHKMIYDGGYYL